jgi:pilus assembly protein Flp/PilA
MLDVGEAVASLRHYRGSKMNIKNFIKKFWKDQSGATAVEYALVAATLSIIIITSIVVVGGKTTETWNTVADAIEDK